MRFTDVSGASIPGEPACATVARDVGRRTAYVPPPPVRVEASQHRHWYLKQYADTRLSWYPDGGRKTRRATAPPLSHATGGYSRLKGLEPGSIGVHIGGHARARKDA